MRSASRSRSSFTVGEYDIVILSAKQSDGLETWLHDNGYRIPAGAAKALAPYIQDMKFFVAKVNLKEQAKTGFTVSAAAAVRVRIGKIHAAAAPRHDQRQRPAGSGRVHADAQGPRRDQQLPHREAAGQRRCAGVREGRVPAFYKALFGEQATREGLKAVFTEYFWDMAWCDPCAADPLSPAELRQAGVFWVGEGAQPPAVNPRIAPMPPGGGAAGDADAPAPRYTPDTFPEDLMFQETARQNFQARYVLRHAAEVAP